MMEDIVVIQSIYGADTTTRTGNTTYGFHSNADVWLYDFTQNPHPVLCIYDASGNDTLDLSGWNTPSKINLAPGSFSNCDMMTNNISIAKTAWIENAIGGGGNDTIIGNILNNMLDGGGGSDLLTGAGGQDTFVLKFPMAPTWSRTFRSPAVTPTISISRPSNISSASPSFLLLRRNRAPTAFSRFRPAIR